MIKKILNFVTCYINTFLHCLFIFTIGIFSIKYRTMFFKINDCINEFNPKKVNPRPQAVIPEVEIAKITNDSAFIQIREAMCADGNISPLEMIVMNKIIMDYSPTNLFEIGTFDGRTTLNMAVNSPEKAKVFTLDLPKRELNSTKLPITLADKKYIDKEVSGNVFHGTDVESKISQLYGDSALFDFSPFHNSMNFIFIDGAHSYEYVLNDSLNAIKMLKDKKGVIFWHDYDTPHWFGVTKALNELYEKHNIFKDILHVKDTSLVCLISL